MNPKQYISILLPPILVMDLWVHIAIHAYVLEGYGWACVVSGIIIAVGILHAASVLSKTTNEEEA